MWYSSLAPLLFGLTLRVVCWTKAEKLLKNRLMIVCYYLKKKLYLMQIYLVTYIIIIGEIRKSMSQFILHTSEDDMKNCFKRWLVFNDFSVTWFCIFDGIKLNWTLNTAHDYHFGPKLEISFFFSCRGCNNAISTRLFAFCCISSILCLWFWMILMLFDFVFLMEIKLNWTLNADCHFGPKLEISKYFQRILMLSLKNIRPISYGICTHLNVFHSESK